MPKATIHPAYEAIEITCSCGNRFETGSTLCRNLHIDVCEKCHPFYTGKQRLVDTTGRVQLFEQRLERMQGNSATRGTTGGESAQGG